MAWMFEVQRDDIARVGMTDLTVPAAADLADSEALLEVERFALTANNITYAKTGQQLGYWTFFPAQSAGAGVVPAWGFARVVQTRSADARPGQRVYGFLPMATHVKAVPKRQGDGFIDAAPHRAKLPAIYNHYATTAEAGATDDHRALLQPLLITSHLVDQYLADAAQFGARRIYLSSASSKTALGLAWFLRQRGAGPVIGLTSTRNLAETEALACYDALVSYDAIGGIAANSGDALYIDFAGNRDLTAAVHSELGPHLIKSIAIGMTHWDAAAETGKLPGTQPEFFFAPTHARTRMTQLGPREFQARYSAALGDFISANRWLDIQHYQGQDGLQAAYRRILAGDSRPRHGVIVRP